MASFRRSRMRNYGFRRLIPAISTALVVVSLVAFTIGTTGILSFIRGWPDSADEISSFSDACLELDVQEKPKLPTQPALSLRLGKKNLLPPRNLDLFPKLARGHVKIVLYVHNRPQYLQVVVDSLSKVEGIGETLLIVSHDGYFEEMDKIVKNIKFCQVKQIYAPFSPHLFPNSFPGVSPGDCYGNHRSPKIVSLKHHWWWMMNTVWDGLEETREFSGHILFIEEDHFILPNAYRSIELLINLKARKCPDCFAANLAPSDVSSKGEGWENLIAERIGNVGYAFNKSIWRKIHSKARHFCTFDEYNWDITMGAIYPSFGTPVYTLRGPRRSAVHFVEEIDYTVNIKLSWDVYFLKQGGNSEGFKGWGGWGDKRDHELCLSFAYMYHNLSSSLC
ncbi:unnamed protein product [Spirodela intermedia]|uniref:Alpha-1,6-mannosyl-glycoprotein 2-beta-N-acetylglucosaminyltransferase n=1 Tax=Spirodela intermedia TaxID=51605 RepID=A0A7I8J0G2_SPIIN|nr:unnamed protein product [Spirodela intermedia]CAA6662911.1 unnamed protein product [Spirodela intermedia]